MDEKTFVRIRDWVEPAHPAVVKQFEDLISIYRIIREKLQPRIDAALDRVAREIGFVVTTTVPAVLEIAREGNAGRWSVSEPLRGSLFERATLEAVGDPSGQSWKGISPGTYSLYLVWYDALKLKLRKDWLEPVHYLRGDILRGLTAAGPVRPEVQEPAHWFHPAVTIAADDQILISAIDEVYPELRLAERISLTRQLLRRVRPEVMEPAHIRPEVMEPAHPGPGVRAELAIREIGQLLRRVRPDVMEPAHFRPLDRDVLAEIQAVLGKFGA